MPIEWKDASSHRVTAERPATSWEYSIGGMKVYVTSSHLMWKPSWAVVCREVGLGNGMKVADAGEPKEAAQAAAISEVRGRVTAKIAGLLAFMEATA